MTTDTRVTNWLQHTHLDKLYGYLPGLAAALPSIFGLTADEYEAQRRSFADATNAAAADLLADPDVAHMVDALPVSAGQRILAVGDSLTDDWQSWAEILHRMLQVRRGDDGVSVINAGLSAHTSAMVLRRWPATLAVKPDLVICALGGNDVTRVGPQASKTQVSRAETVANLRELRRIARELTGTAWAWMTPASVNEARVDAHQPFRFGNSTWRNADIVALASEIHQIDEDPVIDLVEVFGIPADPALQGDDGVHPNLDGQQEITKAVLSALTE